MFKSEALKMAIRTFKQLHPDFSCPQMKETNTQYNERNRAKSESKTIEKFFGKYNDYGFNFLSNLNKLNKEINY